MKAASPDLALGFLRDLWRMNHSLERRSARMQREVGVTAQQRFILRCIGDLPAITAAELAADIGCDPGTLSASLQRLERKGLVKRVPGCHDARQRELTLTVRGTSMIAPQTMTVEHAVKRLLATNDSAAVETTRRILRAFTDHLSVPDADSRSRSARAPETRAARRTVRQENGTALKAPGKPRRSRRSS